MTRHLRMNQPSRNALSSALMRWLEDELDSAGDEPLLLSGSREAFCAGLDLAELGSLDAAGMEVYLRRIDALARRLYLHPAPTVAAVTGHAIAGGCVLALCCDVRVSTTHPKARIGLNEMVLGACYPPTVLAIVRNRLPTQHRDLIMLGAQLFAPEDALRLGLVDELADDPLAAATTHLESLAAYPRATYAHTKSLLRTAAIAITPEDDRRFREDELPKWSGPEAQAQLRAALAR